MPQVRVVIQSRLSSARLPAKAVLPVVGMPSVVLCALRAANLGAEVVVATSSDSSDDIIAETVSAYGIRCVRGPLDDVLGRYEMATRDLGPGSIVVRLTADNLFPDGEFVAEIAETLLKKDLEYLGTNSPLDGLPYGLSAEAFWVEGLRTAFQNADSAYDREHVTPWIRRNLKGEIFRPSKITGNLAHLRCTLDTFDDYLRLIKVFDGVPKPLEISWYELCERLSNLSGGPINRVPYLVKNGRIQSSLTLGTAQLGMKYGIANQTGQPSTEEAKALIRQAISHGVTTIDTARAYGEAETRVGTALSGGSFEQVQVITKLDPLADLGPTVPNKDIRRAVDASVFRSCRELCLQQLPVLMLHRWPHRHDFQEIIWQRLLELKSERVIGQLGASVQTPTEALEALAEPEIHYIQLPYNILDWRWREEGVDKAALKREDVIIHVRSVLLQGILTAKPEIWPKVSDVNAAEWYDRIQDLVRSLGRKSAADLCFAYVRSQKWIDSMVVGMENLQQLQQNIELINNAPLTDQEAEWVESKLGRVSENLLNPAKWPR